jgi:Ca2+-binding EF-hand superfamily protein
MKKLLLLGAAILTVQALPALAEDGGKKGEKHMKMFEAQDTDKDGAISESEFQAFTKKRFDEIDGNKDGKVTKEEAKTHHEAMKAKWKEKREAMKKAKEGAKPEAGKTEQKPVQ